MKRKLMFLALICLAFISRGQPPGDRNHRFSLEEYFKKSKIQKNTGFILLGGGAALFGAGSYTLEHATDKNATGAFIMLGGVVMAATSIPFFISSFTGKHKAKLGLERNASAVTPAISKSIYQTSVSLRIDL
jgi:hypothetical protein